MVKRGHGVPVIGVARNTSDHARLSERAKDSPEQHGGLDRATFAKLSGLLRHVGGDYSDPATGCDILTSGGPGLMQAANEGAQAARGKADRSRSRNNGGRK